MGGRGGSGYPNMDRRMAGMMGGMAAMMGMGGVNPQMWMGAPNMMNPGMWNMPMMGGMGDMR